MDFPILPLLANNIYICFQSNKTKGQNAEQKFMPPLWYRQMVEKQSTVSIASKVKAATWCIIRESRWEGHLGGAALMGKSSFGDFAWKSVNQGKDLQETRIHWCWCSEITCTLQVLQVAMKSSLCSWFRKTWCSAVSLLPFRKGHQCIYTPCCKCSLIFEIIHVMYYLTKHPNLPL